MRRAEAQVSRAPVKAVIRPARRGDAARIAELANRLNVMMGEADGAFTAAVVRRDLFGRKPAVEALVADSGGGVAAYALYHDGYDSDFAARSLFLVDMFVEAPLRRSGIGRALLAAVAKEALRRGARSVSWAVLTRNRAARTFYKKIGAKDEGARINDLYGKALARLAFQADRKQ